jgi:Ca2+-binding RTX toxin-like protein
MNEPHVQSASQWLDSANAAIAAIRSAGATQTILVPGTAWDGAWTWVSSDNDNVIGAGVIDPANNYAFEVHQYFDQWSSGTSTQVMSDTVGAERLVAATQWAEATGQRLFLGEFGAGSDPASLAALKNMLGYMAQHQSAWLGATIWGGGPWWGDYMFSVEPTGLGSSNVTDKPQFTVLSSFANASDATTLISGGTPGSLAHSSLTLAGFQGTEAGDTYVGSDSAESARMLGGDDVVRALGGDDVIYGNLGSDLIYGNLGSDQLFGGQDADTLFAGQGDDLVYGNFAADLIYGNFGQDRLFGGQGNDTIFGGQGDDTLLGGLGDDLLLGNLGADRFVFGANSGRDRIIGFDQRSGDLIDLGGQSYNVRSAFDGSAELLLSGGGAITLAGISAGQVNAGMFG